MSQRKTWQFRYVAQQVADSAQRKVDYHEERAAYWEFEIDKAKQAIEDAGIDIRSYEVTGGQRHEVVVDMALSNRLAEAQSKHREHQNKIDEYEMWQRVLAANADEKLLLDAEDVDFFGLAEVEVPA